MNEPGTSPESATRRVELAPSTTQASARYFGEGAALPTWGVTIGLSAILAAGTISDPGDRREQGRHRPRRAAGAGLDDAAGLAAARPRELLAVPRRRRRVEAARRRAVAGLTQDHGKTGRCESPPSSARSPRPPWLRPRVRSSSPHRGASGYAPEHTIAAYTLAMEQGADYVEQDLTLTRDGVLVCLHDDTLERTTDVETRFPDRAVVETGPDGQPAKRWVCERLHAVRAEDAGRRVVVRHAIRRRANLTFEEAIALVEGKAGLLSGAQVAGAPERSRRGRRAGGRGHAAEAWADRGAGEGPARRVLAVVRREERAPPGRRCCRRCRGRC